MEALLAEITWRPSIGDPDALGWCITLAHLVAGCFCIAAGRSQAAELRGHGRTKHPWFWFGLAALMFTLGLNKQLDLQTLLIQIGSQVAKDDGWYKQRQKLKAVFVFVCAGFGLACLTAGFYVMRNRWRQQILAYVGLVLLLIFVVIRGVPPHFMTKLLGRNSGISHSINAGLEFGGTFLVGLAALLNTRWTKSSPSA